MKVRVQFDVEENYLSTWVMKTKIVCYLNAPIVPVEMCAPSTIYKEKDPSSQIVKQISKIIKYLSKHLVSLYI